MIETTAGNGSVNGIAVVGGGALVQGSYGGSKYLIWSGSYTKDQLLSQTWSSTIGTQAWRSQNQSTGFMGIYARGTTENVNDDDWVRTIEFYRTKGGDLQKITRSGERGTLWNSKFTLVPILES